jgi:hypothetical protein
MSNRLFLPPSAQTPAAAPPVSIQVGFNGPTVVVVSVMSGLLTLAAPMTVQDAVALCAALVDAIENAKRFCGELPLNGG